MNTREFAKKNGKTTEWVRERCKEGIMPTALKKKNGKWDIPEDAELPPCTGREAAMIIENILALAEGRAVRLIPARMARRGEDALRYLANWGFISEESENGGVTVLDRGLALLESIKNSESKTKAKTKTKAEAGHAAKAKSSSIGVKVKAEVKLPLGSASAEVSFSRDSSEKLDGAGEAHAENAESA